MTLSSQAETLLMQNDWRGNVRELKNTLRRAVALAQGAKVLQVIHFAPVDADANEPPRSERPATRPRSVAAFESLTVSHSMDGTESAGRRVAMLKCLPCVRWARCNACARKGWRGETRCALVAAERRGGRESHATQEARDD